jgi:hypothetical protein
MLSLKCAKHFFRDYMYINIAAATYSVSNNATIVSPA